MTVSTGAGGAGDRNTGRDHVRDSGGGRGIPDGLLVGALLLLLGISALTLAATGLSGLLAHGSWPEGVTFSRTPTAMRSLLTDPGNLPGAWADTPPAQLPGTGLFWGVFAGQLTVVLALGITALVSYARWRAARDGAVGAKGTAAAGPTAARSRGPQPHRTADSAAPADSSALASPGGSGAAAAAADPAAEPGPMGPEVGSEIPYDRQAAGRWTDHHTDHHYARRDPGDPGDPGDPRDPRAPRGGPGDPGDPRESVGLRDPGLPWAGGRGERTSGTAEGQWDASRAAEPSTGLVYGRDHASRAADALHAAEGPALVVTADPALWAGTVGARSKLGPTLLYDPSQVTDAPARLRWPPHQGCVQLATARRRSAALLAPVRPRVRSEAAVAEAAETMLRCCLHAAAVSDQPFRQVHRWATSAFPSDAVRVLRTHPKAAGGAAGELESILIAHPERRQAATDLIRRALSSLSQLHVRNACTESRPDDVALETFIDAGGTLYVVGEAVEDPYRGDPGAMPLVTALLSSVVEHGRRMAARSSAGRLDPPLSVLLDQIAVVAPFPELPSLLADGEALGMPTLALLRSEEQTRTWWPDITWAH